MKIDWDTLVNLGFRDDTIEVVTTIGTYGHTFNSPEEAKAKYYLLCSEGRLHYTLNPASPELAKACHEWNDANGV